MTWTLVHESGLLETNNHPNHLAFWTHFFDVFLPSIGWNTEWDGAYNSNMNYISLDKTGIDGYGNALKWHFMLEIEWTSLDALLYRQPASDIGANARDNIVLIHSNSGWKGLFSDGDYLQIWKNDLNAFFVRKRNSTGDIVIWQPADSWMMEVPETQWEGTNAPFLWTGYSNSTYAVTNRAGTDASVNVTEVNYLQPTCGRYRNARTFMTNLITMSRGVDIQIATHINAVSDDTLAGFWSGGTASNPLPETRTVQINGEYYIEQYGTNVSLLYNTGAVDPT